MCLAPKALSHLEPGASPQGTKIAVQSSAESAFQWRGHFEFASSVKRADGISEIEGKAAMGSGERVGKGASFKSVLSVVTLQRFNQSPEAKPPHAAGKRTTFFLPLIANAPFAAGKKVSSTYFLAQATRSRLQLRSSLRLIFSRWLSIVFTLR